MAYLGMPTKKPYKRYFYYPTSLNNKGSFEIYYKQNNNNTYVGTFLGKEMEINDIIEFLNRCQFDYGHQLCQ